MIAANKQRKHFKLLCKDMEFDSNSKKPAGGKSFGVISNKIVNKLLDKSNGNVRGEGSDMLQLEIENCVKVEQIIPFLESFLGFLSGFLEDINSRVINNILYTLLTLQKRLPTYMKSHVKLLIKMLLKVNTEVKKETKILIYQNVKQLMSNCHTQAVVDELLEFSSDSRSRVREDVMNLLTIALLLHPSSELDLERISQTAAVSVADSKRRVRQGAVECLAVSGQCLGRQRTELLLDFVRHLDRKERAGGDIVSAVRARINRKCLPRLSPDGLLEYGVDTGQQGPDVLWVLQGTGPVTHLSAPASLLDVHGQSRRNRAESGAGVKPRTPSLPPMSSRSQQGSVVKIRSTSLYENTKRVIPDIVKHSAPRTPSRDREQPCDLERLLTPSAQHSEAYQTFSRSESLADLRDPKHFSEKKSSGQPSVGKFDVKKCSLVSLGLASLQHDTIFDSEKTETANDELRGAFKHPAAALGKAIKDLKSEDWQVEVEGLSAIVR